MKLHRNEKYVKWGLTAFLVIVAGVVTWTIVSNLRGFYNLILEFLDIISALLYGCFFAYLMNPIMVRWRKRTVSRKKLPSVSAKFRASPSPCSCSFLRSMPLSH